jgi:hypothetical protein
MAISLSEHTTSATTTRDGDETAEQGGARCRLCEAPLSFTLVDLGMSPLCESYVARDQLNHPEVFYPLHVYICRECLLAQLEEYVPAEEIFTEYAYFSSYSDSWVEHARRYVESSIERFRLGPDSQVVELASNDGYLLQHFLPRGIPVLGIEPAANVAEAAVARGVPTLVRFFNTETASQLLDQGVVADLMIGNNVLAQIPDVNDFVAGMKRLLNRHGVITLEFPHLLELIRQNQFDTIYHEHFSYFSLHTVARLLERHGLEVFDVEILPTHGGSLRVYGRHAGDTKNATTPAVERLRQQEVEAGLEDLNTYTSFGEQVRETKRKILEFLITARREGKKVAGYGAPGKGNTLLNYCGIRTDFIDFTVDRNPYKQGKFLPGTHIPILSPEAIRESQPEIVVILPWNLKEEIGQQLSYVREWGGKFAVFIPVVEVF